LQGGATYGSSGVARILLREDTQEVLETEVSQQGSGAEPQWGSGDKAPRSQR